MKQISQLAAQIGYQRAPSTCNERDPTPRTDDSPRSTNDGNPTRDMSDGQVVLVNQHQKIGFLVERLSDLNMCSSFDIFLSTHF